MPSQSGEFDTRSAMLPAIRQRNEERVRSGFWPKMKANLARIPFAEQAVAAYFCATDPATPPRVKAILMAALAYFILPIDAVPDLILGLGFTDDLTVLITAYGLVRTHMKPEHLEKARKMVEELRRGQTGA